MKREPTDWDKIFAKCLSHKGLTSKIYNELSKIDSKKETQQTNKKLYPPNQSNLKIDKRHWWWFNDIGLLIYYWWACKMV